MLANQTRAALMTLEVSEQEDEQGHVRVVGITAHLWRAEQLNGVVEVDKDGLIAKAGCCALHQPGRLSVADNDSKPTLHHCPAGPLFDVSSAALLPTRLSHWLNIPGTYRGLYPNQCPTPLNQPCISVLQVLYFSVASAALLHTLLSHWLNIPGTYRGRCPNHCPTPLSQPCISVLQVLPLIYHLLLCYTPLSH